MSTQEGRKKVMQVAFSDENHLFSVTNQSKFGRGKIHLWFKKAMYVTFLG